MKRACVVLHYPPGAWALGIGLSLGNAYGLRMSIGLYRWEIDMRLGGTL